MDKRQISGLNAARSVLVVLERWKNSLPQAAQECQLEVTALTETISQNGRQQISKHGLSAQKAQNRNILAESAVALAGALCSYGTAVNDDRLVAACSYPRSRLLAGRDAQIVSRCLDLLSEATPLLDKLGKYKITVSTLTAFEEKIDSFDAVQTSPRDGIAKSAAATRRLRKLFRNLGVLLRQRLDPIIAPLKETEPALFNEYTVARKLVNAPTIAAEDNKIVAAPTAAVPTAKAA